MYLLYIKFGFIFLCRGTIFVFDLVARRYWRHADILAKPSAITASYKEHNQYIVGNKEGFIVLLDVGKCWHKAKIITDFITSQTHYRKNTVFT